MEKQTTDKNRKKNQKKTSRQNRHTKKHQRHGKDTKNIREEQRKSF